MSQRMSGHFSLISREYGHPEIARQTANENNLLCLAYGDIFSQHSLLLVIFAEHNTSKT